VKDLHQVEEEVLPRIVIDVHQTVVIGIGHIGLLEDVEVLNVEVVALLVTNVEVRFVGVVVLHAEVQFVGVVVLHVEVRFVGVVVLHVEVLHAEVLLEEGRLPQDDLDPLPEEKDHLHQGKGNLVLLPDHLQGIRKM